MTQSPSRIGRYEIAGELGRGGMGVVFAAHDPALDRSVAVKVIRFERDVPAASSAEVEARFLREARLAARLQHPSVATVYDAGRDGDSLFLVMERVDGDSLARRLQRGDFPSPAESLALVAQVADALAAAHAGGIIHRDVKPANILLTRSGQVKVSDFGVAKAVGESTELTHTGSVLGSPAYMAPEQVQGLEVDGRADLFSLGVVLYELLLHRKPFPADTVTTLIYQILHQDPFNDSESLRPLGDDLAAFLRWALAKQPAQRVPDAATFAARARALGTHRPVVAGTNPTVVLASRVAVPASPSVPPPSTPRRPVWPWAIVAALLAVVAGAALLMTRPPSVPPSVAGAGSVPATTAASDAPRQANPASTGAGPAVSAIVPEASVTQGTSTPQTKLGEVVVRDPVKSPPPAAAPSPVPVPAAPAPPTVSEAPREPAAPVASPYQPPAAISDTFRCRQAAEFNVSPEEAHVSIDGREIGIADDWDGSGGGKDYTLSEGEYVACFALPKYKTACVRLVISPHNGDDVCDVDTELDRDHRSR